MTKQKIDRSKPHYIVRNFYARNERSFVTEVSARKAIAAHGLVTQAGTHYAELWQMNNEEDGEMLALFENSQLQLFPA